MTRIDPSRIQALITQDFDNPQASGQLDGRSVQMGQAQGSRVQSSASGFINKLKSLYDRDIRLQRAEEGVTRGVKNFDKALDKLLDAMKPDNKGGIDLAKARRCLEALPGSAKSATSRGAELGELMEARFKLSAAKLSDDRLIVLYSVNQSSLSNLKQKQQSMSFLSGREQKLIAADRAWLNMLDSAISTEIVKRGLNPYLSRTFSKELETGTLEIDKETQSIDKALKNLLDPMKSGDVFDPVKSKELDSVNSATIQSRLESFFGGAESANDGRPDCDALIKSRLNQYIKNLDPIELFTMNATIGVASNNLKGLPIQERIQPDLGQIKIIQEAIKTEIKDRGYPLDDSRN